MFCVFPQGWITSSWCDGPVSTSTGQNRQRDCTHHAKLRMTQFLLQPEISHYYFFSWIKSMTCERQRPCRLCIETCTPFGHGCLTMLKELRSWESKAHLIICLQTQMNFDLPTCSETTHECLSRYWFADMNSAGKDPVHVEKRTVLIGPGWSFTWSLSVGKLPSFLQMVNLQRNMTIIHLSSNKCSLGGHMRLLSKTYWPQIFAL